ncbi:elongation of very long chain fatty acids protein 4 [Monomorium pharaonis]|uniref:elongation of very long chain fatty acids protein 4 n=1 Tax=Monomorium pharaonis TaxID=307658 RepID=UPI00174706C6|nr:elongation of very long chain fatty acids protein 4 [Monomorium pharaonis]XP_036141257.1 elongation of very long chain fatty acids protein 4 [Monomorium pharaonis]XP_036141266.1 elongation of very long chain fatty acids protein 4 [Monomorium pharaonis]
MDSFTDPRTIKWTFISSPIPIISILLIYIYVVYFGPQFMKNKKPYSLKTFIQCYNLFQIIANSWLMFNAVTNGRPFVAVWRYCDSFDDVCGDTTEKNLENLWWGLLLKIIDLIETVIFVLRKKDRQISFLHTYHHISTVIYVWLTLRYLVHSFTMTGAMLNCFVHVIMYSYYFLSTFGSNIQQRLLPFKKSLTIIQMAQLAFFMIATLQGLRPNCGNIVVKYFSVVSFLNVTINLLLFLNFYGSSYKKSKIA